jgi:hypothetical protein
MKKIILPIVILVLLLIGLIPIKTFTSDRPYYSYDAFLYKYIKYYDDSLYNFNYKEEIHIFPTNYLTSTEEYWNRQIHQVYAISGEQKVETQVGDAEWNKVIYDSIFPIARNYKEVLNVKNNDEITFLYMNNVSIDDVMLYDVKTTNSIEDKITYNDQSITVHDLEKGEYVINLKTKNGNNKVEYSFKINIEE